MISQYDILLIIIIFLLIVSNNSLRNRIDILERKNLLYGQNSPIEEIPGADEVEEYLRQNQKIMAIKVYREKTGVGLAEAKKAVEELEAQLIHPNNL